MALTAGTVAADVRARTNKGNAQNPSDATLVSWINSSALHLYDMVIDREIYTVSYSTASLAGSTNLFPLPSDFNRLRGFERQNSSFWTNVDKLPYSQRNGAVGPVNGTYRLRYYPNMPAVQQLSDPLPEFFDGSGWWEWISLDVSCTVMDMLGLDSSPFAAQRQRVQERIDHASPNRNVDQGLILDPWRGRQAGFAGLAPFGLSPGGATWAAPSYGYVGPEAGNLIVVPTLYGGGYGY
jgi:hypothetical protein